MAHILDTLATMGADALANHNLELDDTYEVKIPQ